MKSCRTGLHILQRPFILQSLSTMYSILRRTP
uniref:Uncharacterized protein n=1 Tax=Pseudomonas phage BL5 TaxID=3109218 RepID=A0AAU7B9H9_9VIRU